MKLTIQRTELAAALAAVKSPAVRGGSIPILSNVLVAANEKSVTFTSTDMDITLRTTVEAVVHSGAGTKTTARAALLHDVTVSTDGKEVLLELVKNVLHVTSGQARFRLNTLDAEEFPPFSRVKDAVEFSLDDAVLHSLLQRTVFATSNDDARAILCGSLLQLEAGKLKVVATDGRRLAVASAEVSARNKLSCVIPARAAKELLRLLNSNPEKPRAVTCAIGSNVAQFTFNDTVLVTRLIEGQYPNYHVIIPDDKSEPVATIGRPELLHSVERIALVSDGVKLQFNRQSLLISSHLISGGEHKELMGDADDSLLVASQREITAKLSTPFLLGALRANPVDELAVFHADNRTMFKAGSNGTAWLTVIAGLTDAKPAESKAPAPAAPAATKPATKK